MKADRGLDAKIAKFMGWTYIPDSKKRLCWKTPEGWLRYKPPAFSTNMTMAMLVVEKMNLLVNYQLCQSHNASKWLITYVHKDFDDAEECWLENYVCADTAPEAICLAALKAMENKNE